MKVSIKNLHITFMGQGEPEAKTAPSEFYSPLERELRTELEKSRSEGVHLSDTLVEVQRQRNDLREQRDKLVASNKRFDAELINVRDIIHNLGTELAQIGAWVADYDAGSYPDHNAEGIGAVSKEVLHMLRDFQADIESRPLPTSYEKELTKALRDLFAENEKASHPQWNGSPMRERCQILLNMPVGWEMPQPAPAIQTPQTAYCSNAAADPVGVGQPEPETAQKQPAAPESAMPSGPTGNQAPTARKCPGFNCSNDLLMEQTYCMAEDCAASHNARFPQVPSLPPKETFDIRAALAAKESFGEPGPLLNNEAKTAEQKALSALLPPCKHAGCDEPTQPGRNFCQEHRKPAKR